MSTYNNFDMFRKDLLNKQIGRKKVSLSEIRLISENCIEFAGMPLALSDAGFKSLLKLVGISKKLRMNLIKQYGDSFADNLVSTMSSAMGQSKGDVVLLIDMLKAKVINIVRTEQSMIPNEQYLKNVENIINDSNLTIDQMSLKDNGGFNISTIGDNTEWNLDGAESSESFKFGLNFDNDPITGTRLMPYNQRLICTNGMIGQGFTGVHTLTNDKDSWDDFFHKVDLLKKDGFRPIEFDPSLKTAMKADASVAELTQARNLVKANSKITDLQLEQYLPIANTEEAYKKNGILIDELNKDQKENAQTGVGFWEVINGVTDLASHNYGHELKNAEALQRFAGRMFVKRPDLSNLVLNPFAK